MVNHPITLPLLHQVANLELNDASPNSSDVQSSESDALSSSPSSSDDISTSTSTSSCNCLPSSSSSLDSLSSTSDISDQSASCDQIEHQLPINDSLPQADNCPMQATQPTQQNSQPSPPLIPISNVLDVREWVNAEDRPFSIDTEFSHPRRYGCYSCLTGSDGNRSYREDKSCLRYFTVTDDKHFACSLQEGYSDGLNLDFHSRDELFILQYITENYFYLMEAHPDDEDDQGAENEESRPIADFICSSEVLIKIMTTPYSLKQSWTLIGVKVRGSIVIVAKEMALPSKRKLFEERKFLEKITRRHDRTRVNPEGDHECFYSVSRALCKQKRLIYSFPVHGTSIQSSDTSIDLMKCFQSQLRPANMNATQRKNYWRTYGLNLWCACLLGKVDRLIFGEREPSAWVKVIDKSLRPCDIPKSGCNWSPKLCVDFLDRALSLFMNEIKLEQVLYKIRFNSEKIVCEGLNEPAEKYIPSWFLQTPVEREA